MCQGCVDDGEISQGVFDLIEAYNRFDPEAAYGGGHIVFADANIEDGEINYCLTQTDVTVSPQARAFLQFLLTIPIEERIGENRSN
jgi:hypothetical protein